MAPNLEMNYLIDTGYACAGVTVRHNTVVAAAPIFGWMVGKSWDTVKEWHKIKEIRHNTYEIENKNIELFRK